MIEQLFTLLDALVEKEKKTDNIIEILGGTGDEGYLYDEMKIVEQMIIKAFGGNEGHYKHIGSTDLFFEYKYNNDDDECKKELIDYIKLTIENDWTKEVESSIVRM